MRAEAVIPCVLLLTVFGVVQCDDDDTAVRNCIIRAKFSPDDFRKLEPVLKSSNGRIKLDKAMSDAGIDAEKVKVMKDCVGKSIRA